MRDGSECEGTPLEDAFRGQVVIFSGGAAFKVLERSRCVRGWFAVIKRGGRSGGDVCAGAASLGVD